MSYDLYPAVDDDFNFPPEVREALAKSQELRNTVIPMTTSERDNLTGPELWNGRIVFNTDTKRINRYDGSIPGWVAATVEPVDYIVNASGKTAATAPSVYPMGQTIMQVGSDASWPNGIGVGTILMFKASSANRMVQMFVSKDNKTWTRTEDSGDIWTPWRRLDGALGQLSTTYSAAEIFPGNAFPVSLNYTSDGTRKLRIVARGAGRCNAAGGTGHYVSVQRAVNGAAATVVEQGHWIIYGSNVSADSFFFEVNDTPPAGSIVYSMGLAGHGINGNATSQHRLTLFDEGPA